MTCVIVVWGEIGLLIQVVARWEQSEADQNSFGGRRFGAEDAFSARWMPASAPAIPALLRRFAANRRADSALFSKNHGHTRKSWNIFFRFRVLSNSGRTWRWQGRFARLPNAAHWWFPTSHQTARDMIMPNDRGVSSRVRTAEPTSPSLKNN